MGWERKGREGELRIGHYVLGKTIGTGTFGKVKVAEHELLDGHKVAVKILNKEKVRALGLHMKIQREIQFLKLFRHPHVIKLYDVIETPTDIFLVMEYVNNGELFDFIVKHGRLSESGARRFFQQIIAGVEYCHSHMVVHRDLKPENLLLDKYNNVKVADFGLSNIMTDGDFLNTSCGSPNYAAPEVISGKLYAGPEVDVWSCGVVLFALLCGRLPFDDEYIPALFTKIRGGIYEIPPYVSSECSSLLQAMLQVDPLKRITMAEIRAHPWFFKDLPQYLQEAPSSMAPDTIEKPDPAVVAYLMQKLEYADKSRVVEELRRGNDANSSKSNAVVVAYHMVYDRMYCERKMATSTVADLVRGVRSKGEGTPDHAHTSAVMNLRDDRLLSISVDEETFNSGQQRQENLAPASTRLPRHNWKLGVMSTSAPNVIMQHLLGVLRNLQVKWRFLSTYQLRCLYVAHESTVKFAIQLFQVREGRYLLDVKRLRGEVFTFFDLDCRLLREYARVDTLSHFSQTPSLEDPTVPRSRSPSQLQTASSSSVPATPKRSNVPCPQNDPE